MIILGRLEVWYRERNLWRVFAVGQVGTAQSLRPVGLAGLYGHRLFSLAAPTCLSFQCSFVPKKR